MSVPHNQRLVEKCESKITKSTQEDHVSTILSPPTGSGDEKQYILITGLELPFSSLAQQSIISKTSIPFNLSRKPYHLHHSCSTQGKYVSHHRNNRNLQFHV
jgi:hypothetical protein